MHRNLTDKEYNSVYKSIKEYGFCKVENFLDKDFGSELLEMTECAHQEHLVSGKSFSGALERDKFDKIIYSVHNTDIRFINLLSSEPVTKIGKYFLNDEHYRFIDQKYPNYSLLFYNARSSGNRLDLHIDSGVPFIGKFPSRMQFVFLLEDSTALNGCTVVVPKSHQLGEYTDRSLDLNTLTKLEGKKGDMIIWDSRLWHGTLENISKVSRWALIATFGRWWIKPSVDIVRSLDQKIYDQCTDVEKQLMGFCSIPPTNPYERLNTKCGFEFLKAKVEDY